MTDRFMDLLLDYWIFLPLTLAQGRRPLWRVAAMIVYVPWFFFAALLGLPFMMVCTFIAMWDELSH